MYDDAFKTYEVSKLLGISSENDEMTIREMMATEKETRYMNETT